MSLQTYADAVQHAIQYLGQNSNAGQVSAIAGATQAAMNALQASSDWRYYRRSLLLDLHATVSLSSGQEADYVQATYRVTWPTALPSWFGPGCCVNVPNNVLYYVKELVVGSTTDFILQPFSSPGADVTWSSATLCQTTYNLPDDFNKVYQIVMSDGSFLTLLSMSTAGMQALLTRTFMTGTPRFYSFVGSTVGPGKMAIQLSPVPNIDSQIAVAYVRQPRTLRIRDYREGTVTATAASSTVTGNGTSFTARMEGSIFRVTDNGEYPTGLGDVNPYSEQRTVRKVNSATELILDSPLAYSYSKKKYVISDPLDIPDYMQNYLKRLIEQQVRITLRMDSKADETMQLDMELMRAQEQDMVNTVNGYANPVAGFLDLNPQYAYNSNPNG